MGAIITRTVDAVDDVILQLSNDQCARQMTILDDWTYLRIGLRLTLNGTAGLTGTPEFVFGVQTGVALADLYGAATCQHFAGVRNNSVIGYAARPGGHNYFGLVFAPCKKVTTVKTTGSNFADTSTFRGANRAGQDIRNCFFVDIVKGSPNFTFRMAGPAEGAALDTDRTIAAFESAMEIDSLANIATEITGYIFGSQTLAVDEADGVLDSIGLYWDRTAVEIEISDIAYRRMA